MSADSWRPAFLIGFITLALVPPARANMIVNGSFETGPATTDAMLLDTGSTAIASWVVSSPNVDYVGSRWTAAEGFRSVGLNGTRPGSISQTFTTVPSEMYNVRFYMAGDPETLPAIKHLRVSAAGSSKDCAVDLTGMWSWDPGWTSFMFNFTTNTASTTLTFTSLDTGEYGPAIDSITVSVAHPVDAGVQSGPALALSVKPNPVRDLGSVDFSLARIGYACVRVLDVRGCEVAVLARGEYTAGSHHASWNALAATQRRPAGIYFIELRSAAERRVQRVAVLR